MKYLFGTVLVTFAIGLVALPAAATCPGHGPFYNRPFYGTPFYGTPYYSPPIVKEVVIKEVVAPVAIPVIVPATVFQYLPAVSPSIGAVPTSAPVGAPMTTSVGAPTAAATSASPCNDPALLDKLIRARLEVILKEQLRSDGAASPTSGPGIVSDSDELPTLTFEEAPRPLTRRSATWHTNLKAACIRCHQQGTTTRGDVALFDTAGNYAPNVSESAIINAVRSGKMPKGVKLNDSTKQLLLEGLGG